MSKKADKILNTTINLFIRSGVKKITMDDIAAHSKASKVTIYKYFEDKDTLYLEAGRRIFAEYGERLEGTLASGEALVKKLYGFMEIISDFTNSGKFELCRALAGYNHGVEKEYAQYLQTYRQCIYTLIDEGIESGLIKDELDRDAVFYYIDMGVVYYQQSDAYRSKMLGDSGFQAQFMLFYIGNIFTDAAQVLLAL